MKELLISTQLPVKEIAFKTGFEYVEHCTAYFKKRTNMTMKAYRDFAQRNKPYKNI
jgi:transcriptional regulator GlxA family with amidase domain